MIRLKTLHLVDWRQHEDLKVSFGPGLNLILGRNGAGKSNLLQAICYLLTGTTSDEWNKAANLRIGAEKGRVEGRIDTGESEIRIVRDITTARCSLERDGEEAIRKHTDANEKLSELLGLNLKLLRTYAFIPQESFSRVVSKPDDSYRRMLQRLFWVHNTEAIRSRLLKRIQRFPVSVSAVSVDELDAIIAERKAEVDNWVLEQDLLIQKLDKIVPTNFQDTIGAQEAAEMVSKELPAASRAFLSKKKKRDELKAEIEGFSSSIDETERDLDEAKGRYENRKAMLAKVESAQKQRESYRKRKDDLLREPDEHIEPAAPDIPEHKLTELNRLIAGAEVWLEQSKFYLENFRAGKCPTCKAVMPNSGEKIAEIELKMPGVRDELASNKKLFASTTALWNEYREERSAWEEWLRSWNNRRAAIITEEEDLPDIAASEEEISAAQEKIATYHVITRIRDDYRSKREQAMEKMVEVEADVAVQKKLILDLESTIDNAPLPEQYDAAVEERDKYNQMLASVNELKGKIAGADSELDRLDAEREKTLETQRKNQKIKGYADLLEAARDVLHPGNLPADIIMHYMSHLQRHITDMLENFHGPFNVELNEADMTFNCYFIDKMLPSYRLSSGQKYTLAISFIFGLNQMFAHNLGFITLDEPTAFLDDENKASVPEVFSKVQEFAKTNGSQVLVISHEKALTSSADNIINI